ncbi:MAG: DUF616 domain-containing protein [Dongiaceae bacterium]
MPAAGARLTIYTAITAGYDALLRQPPDAVGEAELVAFLDAASRPADAAGWRVLPVPTVAGDPVRAAKIYKVLPHRFLPQAAYSLWLDGSVMLAAPFPAGRLVELYLGDADLCLFRHGRRRCCYREAAACLALGLDRPEVIEAQMRRYRAAGHPRAAGLCEASVLLRRHSPAVAAFNEAWWEEICGGSRRDQLSIDFVARRSGVRLRHFPLSLDTPNGLFVKLPHAAPAGSALAGPAPAGPTPGAIL